MKIDFDPCGFWLSEKYDGIRGIWTGTRLLSRQGRDLRPPPWFTAGLPNRRLDGEIYAGRGGFNSLVSILQRRGSDWRGLTFEVFDLAELHKPFEQRQGELSSLSLPEHCHKVVHRRCEGHTDLDRVEAEIVAGGGEGAVLRAAGSCYRPNGFWKVKRLFPDLERWQG